MTQIFTAKTVEEAKALAARTFGAAESAITFEVMEEPKKGLFGFKKGEAKVRATYVSIDVSTDDRNTPVVEEIPAETPVEEAAAEESPVAEETPAEEAVTEETPVEEEVAEKTPAEEAVAEKTPVEEAVAEEAPAEEAVAEEASVEEAVAEEAPVEEAVAEETPAAQNEKVPEDEELVSGEPSETALAKIETAKEYLTGVFKEMGIEAEFEVKAGADSAIINIITANSGTIIGRRGDTLDSLQYLTFLVANRGDKEFYRIILNSADYRERRRKTLEELGKKIAKSVLRTGRTQTLEPMNPYERRIVHSTIAEIEGVSSKSVGEEPYRKVVISSNNAKPGNRRRKPRNDKMDSGKRPDRRRDRRRDPDAPPERISMDSMKTSFEKDYKRPKAEDEINAGLYGKIEF